MPDIVVQLVGVSHAFHAGTSDEVRALDSVDLSLERGSVTVVVGTNGSGKSSLLAVVAGTLAPSSGSVWFEGVDVTRWPEHRRARVTGRVFQDPFAGTAPDLSVAENLSLALSHRGHRGLGRAVGGSRRLALRVALARLGMGLEERLDTPIRLLSGGQRQAITVLMATAPAPLLLLLDEHTAALDPRSADQVVMLTRNVIATGHLTTLMVTHSMSQAVTAGDRLLLMHRGRIVHDFSGVQRQALREGDLLQMFDELRWADRLDQETLQMLSRSYV